MNVLECVVDEAVCEEDVSAPNFSFEANDFFIFEAAMIVLIASFLIAVFIIIAAHTLTPMRFGQSR